MPIQPGQIIDNLVPTEPVVITKVKQLGTMLALTFTGINSQRSNNKVITEAEAERLQIITEEGAFDFSGDPTRFTLFAEAERIHSAHLFDPLFAVNCSIVDPLPHQVEAVYKFLLPLPKIRFLLADDTGAGKTIMTGLLLKELMTRGLVERVLIITPGGLTKQWQEDEMGVKFNIPFTLVNRSIFSADPTVFSSAQRVITSIDFISREDVLGVAANTHWDLIVIDEAHKLSAYEYATKTYKSRRYEAAQRLAEQTEHLLLLTATPHRGRTDTFKKLLQLLDEDIFATEEIAATRVRELENDGLNKFFIRRLKEDMKDWQGQPLYKNRFTQTISYELTPPEKRLYDAVTRYLTKQKEEATQTRNIHVSLALTVMQRRLVSSIYAIRNTLRKRQNALQGVVDEINRNPALWQQRHKLEGYDVDGLDDYDELGDDDREALENILADPRKFKLFTTATSIQEIQEEAREVKQLYELAEELYNGQQAERKYEKLQELLTSQQVVSGEKLVIFTEHKDTLDYVTQRLTNNGYRIATIHGGKTVDERRQAQSDFAASETQVLIATDAAGEGINLQFCRLLINWDIPWNPNRLEQRMGRIHRYGQQQDVLVFNLVASNTREGQVLERLLSKLDIIRTSMGDDRVYDVIQDVLENVKLDAIMDSVLHGRATAFDDLLNQDEETLKARFATKIKEQRERLAHSTVDYGNARELKEESDEKRLQPIYVRLFFERALAQLGGTYAEVRPAIFRLTQLPEVLVQTLRQDHNLVADLVRQLLFCFDKKVFLDYQQTSGDLGKVHYINPGNPVFDALVSVVRRQFRGDMLRGTVLISPDDPEEYLAFFVKSQITDQRPHRRDDSIADERLLLVRQAPDQPFAFTSPAKFLDLHPPTSFAKTVDPPAVVLADEVVAWAFEQVTLPQLVDTQERVSNDAEQRRGYLESAFTHVIMDLSGEISELQGKLLFQGTDGRVQDKILQKQQRIHDLSQRKQQRLRLLDDMQQLAPKPPEVLGCAWVVPLSQVEYKGHYGMSRDDEAEAIAMQTAMDYERSQQWTPTDVSANNEGYDIRSLSPEHLKRYIEVKGRSGTDGSVMVSENEMNRLAQLGDAAWLYIVVSCKSQPELFRIQNPAARLTFEQKSKGVQYFLPMREWQAKLDDWNDVH
ncbi:helicase [Hymenobacter lapidarius]|uniref:Helicase n=1 Tax=Hymenobacter lapidarius TaxID=1908237 RepID=A0A1G1TB10_9BACT|nr:helicase-related protein [Hymenobacter lapidarius]OGX88063.1 helicase [Hymenobacter lapidarius]